jgi:hypothetical protein
LGSTTGGAGELVGPSGVDFNRTIGDSGRADLGGGINGFWQKVQNSIESRQTVHQNEASQFGGSVFLFVFASRPLSFAPWPSLLTMNRAGVEFAGSLKDAMASRTVVKALVGRPTRAFSQFLSF